MLVQKIRDSLLLNDSQYCYGKQLLDSKALLKKIDSYGKQIENLSPYSVILVKGNNPLELLSLTLACLSQKIHVCLLYNQLSDKHINDLHNDIKSSALFNLEKKKISLKENYRTYDDNESCLVFRSSGSTGKPKWIFKSQQELYQNAIRAISIQDINKNSHILSTLPLSHIGGIAIQLLPGLLKGSSFTFLEKWKTAPFFEEKSSYTHTILVPSQLQHLIKIEKRKLKKSNLNQLKCLVTGSTIVHDHLYTWAQKNTIPLISVYGATEAGPFALINDQFHLSKGFGSCLGQLVDGVEIDVSSSKVKLRGHGLAKIIISQGEKISLIDKQGWVELNDRLIYDEKSKLFYFQGRSDRSFQHLGFMIIPEEIEVLLEQRAEIKRAWIQGKNHHSKGDIPTAYLELEQEMEVEKDILRDYLKERLESYKIPAEFIIVDKIPESSIGKKLSPKT